jgi:hypothetical protein
MQLSEKTINAVVDDLGMRLNGGQLRIYESAPSGAFAEPLVSLQLRSPAFPPATGGRAQALVPQKAEIKKTGEATYGELVTAGGEVLATLAVASTTSPEAKYADVLADRTDFHRGGYCESVSIVLRLPV